jgi:hypothetical protein
MTLDGIYKEYCKNRTEDVERKLCNKIKKLAGIVLKQFRIRPYDEDYEEFMQMAYLLFFEILSSYDYNKGKLDGYFIIYFQRELGKFLRKRSKERQGSTLFVDMVESDENIEVEVIYDDLIARFNMKLTEEQRDIFSLMLEGYDDTEISDMVQEPVAGIQKQIKLIQTSYTVFIKD